MRMATLESAFCLCIYACLILSFFLHISVTMVSDVTRFVDVHQLVLLWKCDYADLVHYRTLQAASSITLANI